LGFSRSGVCCLPMPTPIGQPVQAIKQRLATYAARAATALRSEGSERSKDSRPSVSRGNVPTLKRLKRLIATDADEKAFLVSLLPFRVSSACGGVTSSAAMAGGKRPLPVPAFGGPGAPPDTAGEVAQTFRSHSEETSAKAKRGSCETTSI
jgi:hypothetical protein